MSLLMQIKTPHISVPLPIYYIKVEKSKRENFRHVKIFETHKECKVKCGIKRNACKLVWVMTATEKHIVVLK